MVERLQQLPALLVSSEARGEADTLLHFFSPEQGALTIKAKGLRRSSSKLAGVLLPADELQLSLASGRSATPVLTGCSTVRAHPEWRGSLELQCLYWFMAECADLGSASPGLNTEVYTLLANLLRHAPEAGQRSACAAVFALKLLTLHGLLPDLSCCALDGHPLAGDEPAHLLPSGEGLVGRDAYNRHYARGAQPMLRLEAAQLQLWRELRQAPLLDYARYAATDGDAAALIRLTGRRLEELAGRPLLSGILLLRQWKLEQAGLPVRQ
jgi:DNA repair protein RecO (recombination protein O)